MMDQRTPIEIRNRALFWFLVESGCSVSEVPLLRFEHFQFSERGKRPPFINIPGKSERTIEISKDLYRIIKSLQGERKSDAWVFLGFNKHGSLGGAISPRGVELLVKSQSKALGFPTLVPRMIRHSAVLGWYQEGMDKKEIQARLGLRTQYAFRIYAPLFRKHSQE